MKIVTDKGFRTPEDFLAHLVEGAEMFIMLDANSTGKPFSKKTESEHARDAKRIGDWTTGNRPGVELLKTLKSADIQDVRYPRHEYDKEIYNEITKTWDPNPNYRPNRKRSGVVRLPHEKA